MPYYAVKIGKVLGIYNTWAECSKNVTGFTGAIFKKFPVLDDAKAFISDKPDEPIEETKPIKSSKETKISKPIKSSKSNKRTLEIWTDGSAILNKSAGYGFVFVENNEVILKGHGKIDEEPFTAPHAEVIAILEALHEFEKLYKQDIDLNIYIDNQYVVKSLVGYGATRSDKDWEGKAYAEYLKPMMLWIKDYGPGKIKVTHVNSHIGLPYNEMADELATKGRNS